MFDLVVLVNYAWGCCVFFFIISRSLYTEMTSILNCLSKLTSASCFSAFVGTSPREFLVTLARISPLQNRE